MGFNVIFFFMLGILFWINFIILFLNQELIGCIGNFYVEVLDDIGLFYYIKESYDDFYYGKGFIYLDVNGGIGILFEQVSLCGYVQEMENGLLIFFFIICNQV